MKTPDGGLKAVRMIFSKPKEFVFFIISTIIVALSEVFIILSIKNFIDKINKQDDIISFTVVSFVLLVICLVSFLILRNVTKTNIRTNVRSQLIKGAQTSLLNANINDLSKEEVKLSLNNIISNSDTISNYIHDNILKLIQNVVTFIVFGVVSLVEQPLLSLIMFVCLPFYYLSLRAGNFALSKIDKKAEQNKNANINRIQYDLNVIKDIKLKNGIELEKEELDEIVDESTRIESNRSFIKLISNTIVTIIFETIVLAICLGLGGILYKSTDFNVGRGTFFYFVATVPIHFHIVYTCMHMRISPSIINKEANELSLITNLYSEIKSEPIFFIDEVHNFKFKDVSLLKNGEYLLDKISFEIKRNEKIGILVENKETKNAIYDIITKITKDHTGEVLINNCDLNKIQTSYLRTIISSISNENIIFNRSILENIIYPESFDEYKYNDALNRTGLKEIINNYPEKGNTMLTKDLDNYDDIASRVVFANAFYHDSKIYLFNDATLDYEPSVEHQMFEEISKLKNKIVINITDKPYLLNNCDKIMIIEDGKEVEYGKYEDLINDKNSLYYKMIKKAPIRIHNVS